MSRKRLASDRPYEETDEDNREVKKHKILPHRGKREAVIEYFLELSSSASELVTKFNKRQLNANRDGVGEIFVDQLQTRLSALVAASDVETLDAKLHDIDSYLERKEDLCRLHLANPMIEPLAADVLDDIIDKIQVAREQLPDIKTILLNNHVPSTPTTPPNHPGHASPILFTSTKDKVTTERVGKFIEILERTFGNFLNENVQLPLWQPSLNLDDKARRHITSLKIPVISSSSQTPSLLLHNLGRSSHDPQLAQRVDKLFRPNSMTKFLCNTSGSGKTRLLLEGLSCNWGFYFTVRSQPDGVGSLDLEMVLLDLQSRLEEITDGNRATALIKNQNVAKRRFLLLLYARYVCFRVFLKCAAAMPSGITEDHKLCWLLIQVAPVTLLAKSDIFLAFTRVAGSASEEYLENAIQTETFTIEELLPRSTLFCVLDEAQALTKKQVYFQSEVNPAKGRPILCPIVHSWRGYCPNLIISGTGISMREVENVIGSTVAKEGRVSERVTEIGGFDDEDSRRAYLEQYFPPGVLDTSEGKEVTSRVGYWLGGRHRFIATYLSRLIQSGFRTPHQVLNDFVFGMTGVRPSGWYDSEESTVELEYPRGFNFKSLSEESELLPILADFVLEYTFIGKIRGLSGPIGDTMVEYGVSRFKKHAAQTDEPLAILALVTFFEQKKLTLAGYLTRTLNTSDPAYRSIAFEAFGAYLLARAFSDPRLLSEVFEFVERGKKADEKLQNEVAELVALEKVGDNVQITPLKIKTNLRSNHVLGRSPETVDDTLEWLQNPKGSTFCFPANTVGPDLIFVLRLTSDGTVLRVCVQFKHTKTLSPQDSEKAIRTADPSTFLSQKTEDNSSPTCSNPLMRGKLEEAIKNLGNGTEKAGDCGLLRVVISHPSAPDSNALEEAAKTTHPLATVALENLEQAESNLGQTILSLANLALQRPDRKGKSSDEIEGARPKRQRRGADTGIGGPM